MTFQLLAEPLIKAYWLFMRLCAMADVIYLELFPIKKITPNCFSVLQLKVKKVRIDTNFYKN